MKRAIIAFVFSYAFSILPGQAQPPDALAIAKAPTYTSLERALQNPDQVYKLALSKKRLKFFPEEVFDFKNLVQLDLSRNKIGRIPPAISNLKYLERLNLGSNELTDVPIEIGGLVQLKRLELFRNSIRELPRSIGMLRSLEALIIWDNQFRKLPDDIEQLKDNLKILDIRLTFIEDDVTAEKLAQQLPHTKIEFPQACNCSF